MSKNKNAKNKNKKNAKEKEKQNKEQLGGNIFAMGQMDLIFEMVFDDKDLEKPDGQNSEDPYYKIEELNSIKDLSFLKEKKEFYNTIKVKPNNEFMKQVLLGNKISKKKNFIDLICYGRPKFEGEEEFFDEIFNHVTVNNGFQINQTPLEEGSRFSLVIQLKHKRYPEQIKEIKVGTTPSEAKEAKENEEAAKKEEEDNKKKEQEEQEKKDLEERKQQLIQKYKERREKAKKKKEEEENKKNNKDAKKEEGVENNENQNYENQNNENQNNENEGNQYQNEENANQNEEQNNNEGEQKVENNEENKEEKKEENEEDEKDEEPEDYEETEAMKEKKIPKFKRKNILCNLNPSMTKYDLIFLNFEELNNMPGDFKIKYLIELLEHFKKKKSTIFINFYKNEPSEEEKNKEEEKKKAEEKKEEEKRNEEAKIQEQENKNRAKQLKEINDRRAPLKKRQQDLKENKKNEIKEMEEEQKKEELANIEEQIQQINEEEQNLKDEIRAEEEAKKELKKKKEKEREKEEDKEFKKDKKEMRQLNEVFFFTDGYFFDTKQACQLFNKHYLCHTTDKKKNRKVINKQKVFDYFITAVARGAMDEVQGNKIGLFMDDFNTYTVIFCSKKAASKKELNTQPHPKINPHNADIVQKYREIIKKNKNDYYSIFACLAAHEIGANRTISNEVIYPTYLTALEIVKRKVECVKNDIKTINEDQIYKVKINEKALQQEIEKLLSDSKEGGFVLDCTNKSKSTLKDYVALYDYHLRGFFSSQLLRNYLKNKGFIDSKGFIMYDPVYRNVMGAQCKNIKNYEGDELKKKIISSIKGIDVPARIGDKELDAKKAIEKQNVPIDKKIPYVKERDQKKKKKKKKKAGGSQEGSSSSGQSSSDEEGKSGEGSWGNSDQGGEGGAAY